MQIVSYYVIVNTQYRNSAFYLVTLHVLFLNMNFSYLCKQFVKVVIDFQHGWTSWRSVLMYVLVSKVKGSIPCVAN